VLPTDTYQKFMLVVDHIRMGKLPTRACRDAGVSWHTVKTLVAREPELASMFEEALLECRDQMLEILVEIDVRDPRVPYGSADPKMAAVISANIKWVLEKMWPEKFMTKVTVQHDRPADEAITAALNAAIARIPLPRAVETPPMIEDASFRVIEPAARDIDAEIASVL
jgi:hypothetical protein